MTTHGDDARKYKNIIDFASNSNPLGVSKNAKSAIKNNLNKISLYPDTNATELRGELAEYNNINSQNIIAGNGSSEIIRMFCEVFLNKNNGESVLIIDPTFSEYEKTASLFSGRIESITLNSDNNFKYDAKVVFDKINKSNNGIKIIFLCSPNNPTGQSIPGAGVLKLADENPKTYIFLDEAFIEFTTDNSLATEVENYKNLFVLRSMTKFFALAGLRIGYGVGNTSLIKKLNSAKPPWNVNSLAQIAGIESLRDKNHIKNSYALLKTEKQNLFKKLSGIRGLKVYRSDANFFLINIEKTGMKSREMKKRLVEKGILIRDCSNFNGLDDYYVRVCVRTKEENEKLVNELLKFKI